MQVARIIIGDFADNTSAHGFERVKSTGLIERVVYVVVLLVLWSLMLFLSTQLVISFINNDSVTSLTIQQEPSMELPALTICNLNPMKKSQMGLFIQETGTELLDQLTQIINESQGSSAEHNYSSSLEHDLRENMSIAIYQHTKEAWNIFGSTTAKDSMLSFIYQGRKDTQAKFSIKSFLNPTYGNCFTIMPDPKLSGEEKIPTLMPGKEMGLQLRLYVPDKETLGPIVPITGVRLEVHPVNVAPIPELNGFSVSTGTMASIGIKAKKFDKSNMSRTKKCVKSDKNGPVESSKGEFKRNYYDFLDYGYDKHLTKEYSKRGCMMSCFVEKINKNYGCVKASLITSTIVDLETKWKHKEACPATQFDEINKQVQDDIMKNCSFNHICAAPCNYTEYDTNVLVNKFPCKQYLMVYIGEWMQNNPELAANVVDAVGLSGVTGSVADLIGNLLGDPAGKLVGELLNNKLVNKLSEVVGEIPVVGSVVNVVGGLTNEVTNLVGNVVQNADERAKEMCCVLTKEEQKKKALDAIIELARKSIVGVELFFDSMEVQRIAESPKMNFIGLLSNLGGTFGLFIGVSFVTMLEFVFFFIHLAFCCSYKKD